MSDLRDYHAWNVAATRFAAAPDALSPEQAARLDAEVDRAVTLEARILASREALAVSLPFEAVSAAVSGWRGENPRCPISDTVLFEALQRELMVQAVLDAVAARARPVSEPEAMAFYRERRESFHRPERRAVRHILITVNPNYADNTEPAAAQRIAAIADALRGGASFADLATRHSECPTAMKGGEVGAVAAGTLYPEVEAVAFALEPGAWGGPVRTELGWHLVACDAVLPPEDLDFAAVAAQIRGHLDKQRRREAQVDWLRALMARPVLVAGTEVAALDGAA